MKSVAVLNKAGVGKTALAYHLACAVSAAWTPPGGGSLGHDATDEGRTGSMGVGVSAERDRWCRALLGLLLPPTQRSHRQPMLRAD